MFKKIAFVFVVMFFIVNAVFAGGGGKIKWITNYDEGMKEAKKTGKATMLYFTADW